MRQQTGRAGRALRAARRAAAETPWLLLPVVLVASLPSVLIDDGVDTPNWVSATRTLLPQGWGFFTRETSEPRMTVYRRDADNWTRLDLGPSVAGKRGGFDRQGRRELARAESLTRATVAADWVVCRAEPVEACLDRARPVQVEWQSTSGFCGHRVAVVLDYATRWAYRDTGEPPPSDAVALDVRCVAT